MALVCPADRQKRARASVIGVAGKPTTTTPIFLSSISLANALISDGRSENRQKRHFYAPTRVGFSECPVIANHEKKGYSHHFAWHVEQDGDHRGVIVAINDEAHLLQSGPEVSGVFCQLVDPSNTSIKARPPPDVHVRGAPS